MKKIAIVKVSSMGDIAHTSHVPHLVKKHLGQCEIHWFCDEKFTEILENHPFIDKVVGVNSKGVKWKVWKFWKHLGFLKKEYQRENYDFIVDFQGTWKSALIAKSICLCGQVWGFGNTRDVVASKFYENKLFCSMFENVYTRAVKLINEALQIEAKMQEVEIPFLYANKKPKKEGVLVFPSSSKASKNYGVDGFVKIIDGISKKVVLLYGSVGEMELCGEIAKKTQNKVKIVGGLSLAEVKSLILSVEVVIGGDTGVSHIATGLGVKNIVLYGATAWSRTTLPFGKSATLQGNGVVWKIPPESVLKELFCLGL